MKATQAEIKRSINTGSNIGQVSPVRYWYNNGHFKNDDEARGAFFLAYQQGLDGMGVSIRHWMGLSEEEYGEWMKNDALPPRIKTIPK